MNEMQFGEALYIAVILRDDTKFLQLPPPYEMYPYGFFNSEVLEKAHHAKLFGKLGKIQSNLFVFANCGNLCWKPGVYLQIERNLCNFQKFL